MDDLEHALKAGLSAEVGEWSPTPGEVRRTTSPQPRRRLQVALAVAIVLCVSAGGIGVAVGLGGSGHRVSLAQVAASPSPSPSPSGPATGCAPGAAPRPRCLIESVAPPQATEPVAAPATSVPGTVTSVPAEVASPGTMVSATAKPKAKPKPSDIALPAECTAAELHLTVSTDRTSYVQGEPMLMHLTSRATGACEAYGVSVSVGYAGSDRYEWTTCDYQQPGPTGASVCPASLPIFPEKPGDFDAHDFTWAFQTSLPIAGGEPGRFLGYSDLTVRYRLGKVEASTAVHLDYAPTCAASQVSEALSTDQAGYTRGQTAKITLTTTNTSDVTCDIAGGPLTTPATGASGTTVWSGCDPAGLPQNQTQCVYSTVGMEPFVLLPGTDATLHQTWQLMRDGTADSGPTPVPDGSYTLSTQGLTGTLTCQLTVTG